MVENADCVVHVIDDDAAFRRSLVFLLDSVGWRVVNLKYGHLQRQAFEGPAGGALKDWIDRCPK